ncbi:WW domain containing protein [Pyrenophora tritici-repentis]|uniref:DUF2076 multi-domain protein n=2 Tax=Pyrenophora tritici-repentis TaxID=45151 RepID=A0A2W1H219_9PLEO|nr:uncharacterized protein PTRG_03490 [Pyrenophora tritici-repentis Pt-1C-BFP]KAA8620480.1 WW domain-containing protein [Pyrenophora tritici-repentis]EDU46328.1 conserved hypothetical protein [Pyrenophora tritici-repentis Pt-1C-BFP]KAF7448627.1 WW domain containing protein [Pyrenophora tritici-repentis]KAF7572349.1 DUF2076 multi-domain protein [Pyrenophora tritici-repentis]KAG9384471.1 WW domain containing protein [Pyrenophora tritici-repentis]
MADFAPPPGPPPPKVPEGWKAVWNAQYSEWFYVNTYTKQSQWEQPTQPAHAPGDAPPPGAPPGYSHPGSGAVGGQSTGASEKGSFGSNNPYANISDDEAFARKLQEEENARANAHADASRGQSNDYYNNQSGQVQPPQYGAYGQQNPYVQGQYQEQQTQDKSSSKGKGFLGKLLGKASGSSSSHQQPQQVGYGQPAYGHAGAGGYYGGGHGQPMGGGMPMAGGRRPGGGGMGMGGMALGAGGGLLAGGLMGSAMAGDGGDTYVENNYGDDGGMDGGDMGGGDMGGGDMGGDMGGGDF